MSHNQKSSFNTFDINRKNKLKKLNQFGRSGKKRAPTLRQPDDIVIPLGERQGLNDLEEDNCRWPFGDPKKEGFHFCNRKKSAGWHPYCAHHTERARWQYE